jgi:hypothetical protein
MTTTKSTNKRRAHNRLRELLKKLNIKSSSTLPSYLEIESLEATMKSVTFDASNLKLWPKIPK